MLSLANITQGTTGYVLIKVLSVKTIAKTKTNSYYQSIHGVDDSADIVITFFIKDPDAFVVLKEGDIIYFQGKFSSFGNRLQASVQPDSIVQVVTEPNLFSHIDDFKQRYDALLTCGKSAKISKREFVALKDIKKNTFFDLHAMVNIGNLLILVDQQVLWECEQKLCHD